MNIGDLFIENRTLETGKKSKKAIIITGLLHTGVSKFSFLKKQEIKTIFSASFLKGRSPSSSVTSST